MKVYLDDVRETPRGWVRANSAREAIEYLKTGKVVEISLDHDLGDEQVEGTGYEVLEWIEREVHLHGFKPPIMSVHSANAPATERMLQAIAAIQEKAKG
ncbi:MAG: hypothetical protein NTZ35_01475 [Ignavibacteriales bacterium]|nr:hypothetical protein [Ignavibacteriales bacterium]